MEVFRNPVAPLLNDFQVAEILGVSVATVRRWRKSEHGPSYFKIGALVKYRMADVEAFLASCSAGGQITESRNF